MDKNVTIVDDLTRLLTVSIRSENFAKIRLGFPEPSIPDKCPQYYQVKILHSYMFVHDVKIMGTLKKISFPVRFR